MLGLEPLFSWFGDLIDWCVSWFPTRGRCPGHELGIKVTGRKVTEIKPGTYWYLGRWSEVFTDNVMRKVREPEDQVLTTRDTRRVRVGGVLIYHITNITQWLYKNEDPDDGVLVEAARVLKKFVQSHEFEEVRAHEPTGRNDDELTRTAQAELGTSFGIRVERLSFTNFAETEARELHHTGQLGGLPAAAAEDDE